MRLTPVRRRVGDSSQPAGRVTPSTGPTEFGCGLPLAFLVALLDCIRVHKRMAGPLPDADVVRRRVMGGVVVASYWPVAVAVAGAPAS